MIQTINLWAQGIIVAIIITTIIEIILPEGNNKKYVKVILGIYILFSIAYPILDNITKENINFEKIIFSTNEKMENLKGNEVTLETSSYIEKTYTNNLKEEIAHELNEKGYNVLDLKLYIETKNNERYGQINSIILDLEDKQEEIESKIEKINIDVSKEDTSNNIKKIDESKITDLKEYFENAYSIEKERIHINE